MKFQVFFCFANLGLALTGKQQVHNRTLSMFDEIAGLFTPEVVQQLSKLDVLEPPRFMEKARKLRRGSPKQVREYLSRSLLSVCPSAELTDFECICSKTYSDVSVIEDASLDALVVVAVHKKDKQIVVSYRPALSIRNWITNLKYQWAPFVSGRVHKGFLAHFLSIGKATEVVISLLLDKYPSHSLHITGYSLGGASALLSLPYWKVLLEKRNDKRPLDAFLYASPRVGDEAFVNYITSLDIPITRYTNVNDIVSHLPPRSFGFVHAGAEIHETVADQQGNTRLKICSQEYDEDPECGWRYGTDLSIIRHILPLNSIIPLPAYC